MEKLRFVVGGRLVGRDEAARCPVLVAGAGVTEPSTVHAFSSEAAFRAWVLGGPAKRRLAQLDALVARAREPERDEEAAALRLRNAADGLEATLFHEGERAGQQPGAEDLLRRVTSASGAVPAVLPSLLVLYDGYALEGGWRAVAGVVPNLDWITFEDRTSSAWVAGAAALAQHRCFGGQRLYLLGVPWMRVDDLRQYGFDNRASSAAVL